MDPLPLHLVQYQTLDELRQQIQQQNQLLDRRMDLMQNGNRSQLALSILQERKAKGQVQFYEFPALETRKPLVNMKIAARELSQLLRQLSTSMKQNQVKIDTDAIGQKLNLNTLTVNELRTQCKSTVEQLKFMADEQKTVEKQRLQLLQQLKSSDERFQQLQLQCDTKLYDQAESLVTTEQRNKDMTAQLTGLAQHVTQVEHKLKQTEIELVSAQDKLNQQIRVAAAQGQATDDLSEQVFAMRTEQDALRSEAQQANDNLQQLKRKSEQHQRELAQQLELTKADLDVARAKLDQKRQKAESLQQQVQQLEQTNGELEAELSGFRMAALASSKNGRKEALEELVGEQQKENGTLIKRIKLLEQEVVELKDRNVDKQSEQVAEMKQKLIEMDAAVTNAHAEKHELIQQLNETSQEKDQVKLGVLKIEEICSKQKVEIDNMIKEIQQKEAEFNQQLEFLSQQISSKNDELKLSTLWKQGVEEQHHKTIENIQLEARKHQVALIDLQQVHDDLKLENSQLHEQLSIANQQMQTMSDEIKKLKVKQAPLPIGTKIKEMFDRSHGNTPNNEQEINSLKDDLQAFKDKHQQIERLYLKTQSELEVVKQKLKQTQDELIAKEETLFNLRQRTDYTQEYYQVKEEYASLLELTQQVGQTRLQQLDERDQEINLLNKKVGEIQQQLAESNLPKPVEIRNFLPRPPQNVSPTKMNEPSSEPIQFDGEQRSEVPTSRYSDSDQEITHQAQLMPIIDRPVINLRSAPPGQNMFQDDYDFDEQMLNSGFKPFHSRNASDLQNAEEKHEQQKDIHKELNELYGDNEQEIQQDLKQDEATQEKNQREKIADDLVFKFIADDVEAEKVEASAHRRQKSAPIMKPRSAPQQRQKLQELKKQVDEMVKSNTKLQEKLDQPLSEKFKLTDEMGEFAKVIEEINNEEFMKSGITEKLDEDTSEKVIKLEENAQPTTMSYRLVDEPLKEVESGLRDDFIDFDIKPSQRSKSQQISRGEKVSLIQKSKVNKLGQYKQEVPYESTSPKVLEQPKMQQFYVIEQKETSQKIESGSQKGQEPKISFVDQLDQNYQPDLDSSINFQSIPRNDVQDKQKPIGVDDLRRSDAPEVELARLSGSGLSEESVQQAMKQTNSQTTSNAQAGNQLISTPDIRNDDAPVLLFNRKVIQEKQEEESKVLETLNAQQVTQQSVARNQLLASVMPKIVRMPLPPKSFKKVVEHSLEEIIVFDRPKSSQKVQIQKPRSNSTVKPLSLEEKDFEKRWKAIEKGK